MQTTLTKTIFAIIKGQNKNKTKLEITYAIIFCLFKEERLSHIYHKMKIKQYKGKKGKCQLWFPQIGEFESYLARVF